MASVNARPDRAIWMRYDLVWAAVLFLVGAFQVMRGAWGDAAIFAATLALLIAGSAGRLPADRMLRKPSLRMLIPTVAILGVALLLAPRHGPISGIVLGGIGLVAAGIAWSGRRTDAAAAPSPQRAAMIAGIAWSATIVTAGSWEATAYLIERWGAAPDGTMPAISEVLDPLLDVPLGKAVFLLLWLTAGVALLRRGWARGRS